MQKLISYFGRLLSHILFYLPEKFRYFLSWFFTFLFFDGFRFRRKIMMQNIERVFPNKSRQEKTQIVRKHVFYLFYNFFEFCIFPAINEKWIQENIIFEGVENLETPLKSSGVLILALHLGHGDMGISMLAHKGVPLFVISKHFKYSWLNQFWYGTRKRFGAHFIDPHGRNTSFDILKALKNKNAVIFVQDQFMGPPYGVETKFFGIDTGTACGLSLFALKTKLPVIPVYCYRDDKMRTHVAALPAVPFVEGENREKTLVQMTQNYNTVLEDLIQKYPEHWLWIHRRWKNYW